MNDLSTAHKRRFLSMIGAPFRRAWDMFLSACFPRRCLSCAREGEIICDDCFADLPRAEIADIPDTHAALSYRDPVVRALIHALKYKGDISAADISARAIAEEMPDILHDEELFHGFTRPILVPIPLAPGRATERGFNQSERIARHIKAQFPELSYDPSLIIRTRGDIRQSRTKSKTERHANIAGCFAIPHPERVHGAHIILIDDVTTTGATLTEARKVLRRAGARRVICFTAAH